LEAAARHGLYVLLGIPWNEHVDFLSDKKSYRMALQRVREVACTYGAKENVVALLVGNEIEKTLVRWLGPLRVKRFLERLIRVAKQQAADCLVSYATFPSTEYLLPDNADFLAMNLYLEEKPVALRYMRRLHHLAGAKPVVISEFGLDVHTHGRTVQAEVRQWLGELTADLGLAGTVWFNFTDEWWRGGGQVVPWKFGLVDMQRMERPAASVILTASTLPELLISVVVCTRNGAATLSGCLQSLQGQSYPHYEVLVIDDGSTDAVPEIVKDFPQVRYVRQEHAGLSVARNRGMNEARGAVVAYTDDDCRADEDWLHYLALGFAEEGWVAVGGPNIPPPPRNRTEAVVAAAPGGPAHVLLTDEEAEHLPGCNLAIRVEALRAIDGFRAQFRAAGDDVDVCWRLREAGGKLRFVSAAMVWHHRRFTVNAYLKQQRGYGRAEALLMQVHSLRFGPLGGARWRGLIYGDQATALPPEEGNVFHGPLGTGLFQVIYSSGSAFTWWDWLAGVLWPALALCALLCGLWQLSLALLACSAYFAWQRSYVQVQQAELSLKERGLLWLLCWLQPMVREWARLRGMLELGARPSFRPHLPDILPPLRPRKWTLRLFHLKFWSESAIGREDLLKVVESCMASKMPMRWDDGWRWFDVECCSEQAFSPALMTVTEYHGGLRYLTRAAVLLRVRRWSGVVFLGLVMGLPYLWICIGGLLGDLVLTLFTLAIGSFILKLWRAFDNARDLRAAVKKAAAECGLS
jgi:O-antigen biosynthesis protein